MLCSTLAEHENPCICLLKWRVSAVLYHCLKQKQAMKSLAPAVMTCSLFMLLQMMCSVCCFHGVTSMIDRFKGLPWRSKLKIRSCTGWSAGLRCPSACWAQMMIYRIFRTAGKPCIKDVCSSLLPAILKEGNL